MSTIGIIGYGYVGRAVAYGFHDYDLEQGREPRHRVLYYDKYKESDRLEKVVDEGEVIFICLPTPYHEDELRIDLSICDRMIEAIAPRMEGTGKLIAIKSTVVPGTTRRYASTYPDVHFAFNPEFLTESNYLEDFVEADRIVIGADNDWIGQRLTDLHRVCFPRTPLVRMGTTAAEIVKYQCNVLLAAKVAVSNIFFDICRAEGIGYEDVRQAVGMDSRIGTSHTAVTTERGFGGKCFPKDLGAIIGRCRELGVDHRLLDEMNAYNLRIRKVRDWHEIAGARVGGRLYDTETSE